MKLSILFIVALFAALLLGCVGGKPSPNMSQNLTNITNITGTEPNVTKNVTPSLGVGTLRVKIGSTLGQLSGIGLKSANVTIRQIEIHQNSGWTVLNKTVMVLDLIAGSKKSVTVAFATLDEGNYDKIRLSFTSARVDITISSSIPGIIESSADIDAAVTQETEIPISLTVTKDSNQIVTIIIDGEKSIVINTQALTATFNATTRSMVQTLTECKAGCPKTCNSTMQQCENDCRVEKDMNCTQNATWTCKEGCGCIPSCVDINAENCQIACEPQKLKDCRATINATCSDECAVSTDYLSCISACESGC